MVEREAVNFDVPGSSPGGPVGGSPPILLGMKLFIDSADTQEIFDCVRTGFISGVTTNPTLIKKSGRNPDEVYAEILTMGIEDLSMEVVGSKSEMFLEAERLLNKFGERQSYDQGSLYTRWT